MPRATGSSSPETECTICAVPNGLSSSTTSAAFVRSEARRAENPPDACCCVARKPRPRSIASVPVDIDGHELAVCGLRVGQTVGNALDDERDRRLVLEAEDVDGVLGLGVDEE